jgi:type I restriction enzyme, S subunit
VVEWIQDIPESWIVRRLDEVAVIIDSLHETPSYADDGYPMVRVTDVKDGFLDLSQSLSVTEDVFEEFTRRYKPQRGDIIFSRVGTYGNVSYVATDVPFCLGQNTALIHPKINGRFLHFYLQSPLSKEQIEQSAVGSTQKTVSIKSIAALRVPIPPKEELQAIAQILGALDDKIELNRRMNETLESMARAIFKSWFVDFDPVRAKAEVRDPGLPKHIAGLFPDLFGDCELGEIPAGWEIQALYDCADYINGSAFRNEHFSSDRTGLPIIKIAELKDGITNQTKFTRATLDKKYRITSGDILFSWSGSPDTSIDTFIWVGIDGWLNQHIFKVLFKRPEYKYFVYYLLLHFKTEFIEIARNKQTTGLGHVTSEDLKRLKTVFPSDSVLREFNVLSEPIFQKVYSNHCESRQLAALRDALLPKLISGEVRMPAKRALNFSEVSHCA